MPSVLKKFSALLLAFCCAVSSADAGDGAAKRCGVFQEEALTARLLAAFTASDRWMGASRLRRAGELLLLAGMFEGILATRPASAQEGTRPPAVVPQKPLEFGSYLKHISDSPESYGTQLTPEQSAIVMSAPALHFQINPMGKMSAIILAFYRPDEKTPFISFKLVRENGGWQVKAGSDSLDIRKIHLAPPQAGIVTLTISPDEIHRLLGDNRIGEIRAMPQKSDPVLIWVYTPVSHAESSGATAARPLKTAA